MFGLVVGTFIGGMTASPGNAKMTREKCKNNAKITPKITRNNAKITRGFASRELNRERLTCCILGTYASTSDHERDLEKKYLALVNANRVGPPTLAAAASKVLYY
jgi:hypothetical protein